MVLTDVLQSQNRALSQAPHILLVDDSEAYRYALAEVLAEAGYSVRTASDYRTALPILESAAPLDLMITDIMMPGRIHGFSLGAMARARRPELKVVYITGFDVDLRLADGLVLKKSDGVERLVDTVGEILLV